MATESRDQENQEIETYYTEMTRRLRQQGLSDGQIAVEIVNNMVDQAEEVGIKVVDMDSYIAAVNIYTGRPIFNTKEDLWGLMIGLIRQVQ